MFASACFRYIRSVDTGEARLNNITSPSIHRVGHSLPRAHRRAEPNPSFHSSRVQRVRVPTFVATPRHSTHTLQLDTEQRTTLSLPLPPSYSRSTLSSWPPPLLSPRRHTAPALEPRLRTARSLTRWVPQGLPSSTLERRGEADGQGKPTEVRLSNMNAAKGESRFGRGPVRMATIPTSRLL